MDRVSPELIQWFKETAEKGGAFVEREAPLLAQEIVEWHYVSSVFGMAACLACAVLLLAISYACCRMFAATEMEPFFAGAVFCGIIGAGFLLAVPFNAYEAIKARTAPRVVVVDYMAKLAK